MIRAYKFRLRPTRGQERALQEMLRDHCRMYNAALEERRWAYRHPSRTRVRYGSQSAQLKEIRAADPDQARWSFSSQQATLRRLDRAFVAFFRRKGMVKTISVKREGRRWAEALAEAQRSLSAFPKKARRRSKKHRAAARKVATLHAKARRQRLDHHHKTALALVRAHDVIAYEQLNIAGMTRAAKPKVGDDGVFLPNGAAAKAGLNRSIMDAGWGQFLRILANKAESAGRRVIAVDARNTSRTCPACGHIAKENRVTQARFTCRACVFTGNADHVAALNIRSRAGLVLSRTAWPAAEEARRYRSGWSHVTQGTGRQSRSMSTLWDTAASAVARPTKRRGG